MLFSTLAPDQLAEVCGGFDLQHALDAGNSMATSAGESGAIVGGGLGVLAGGISHYRGKRLFGLTTRFPAPAEGAGAGLGAGGLVLALGGWGVGFGRDVYQQVTGKGGDEQG